jgi:transposase
VDHFGIDLHQKHSEICGLDGEGGVKYQKRVTTSEASFRRVFGKRKASRVVIESGCQTAWAARLLQEMGHEVVVVNPRRVRLIAESTRKSDRADAEVLAWLSLQDEGLVRPVYQRSEAAMELRTRLRVRTSLVRARTALINSVRGTLRSQGYRMSSCVAARFVARFYEQKLAPELRQVLDPLVEMIAQLSEQIERLEKDLVEESHADELLHRLQEVPGVGPLVCLSFIGWVDRPERFERSRDVGACLGLRPMMRDSGEKQWRGSITREGDSEMRRLLVQAAHAALNCHRDSTLKRWAHQVAERAGKRKAVVALARKLAVLLHRLWVTGASYQAFPKAT